MDHERVDGHRPAFDAVDPVGHRTTLLRWNPASLAVTAGPAGSPNRPPPALRCAAPRRLCPPDTVVGPPCPAAVAWRIVTMFLLRNKVSIDARPGSPLDPHAIAEATPVLTPAPAETDRPGALAAPDRPPVRQPGSVGRAGADCGGQGGHAATELVLAQVSVPDDEACRARRVPVCSDTEHPDTSARPAASAADSSPTDGVSTMTWSPRRCRGPRPPGARDRSARPRGRDAFCNGRGFGGCVVRRSPTSPARPGRPARGPAPSGRCHACGGRRRPPPGTASQPRRRPGASVLEAEPPRRTRSGRCPGASRPDGGRSGTRRRSRPR